MEEEGDRSLTVKTAQGTIGPQEKKKDFEKEISIRNAEEGDLIMKIKVSQKCQLTVMGSTKNEPDGSAMSGDHPKKEDQGLKSDIDFEKSFRR